jgi:hypothetical protein
MNLDVFKRDKSRSVPQEGDTVVTLRCDKSRPLEDRMELLSYAFAKIVQGAVLRQVVKWDLRNGEIKFIVGDGPALPPPHGKYTAIMEDWPAEGIKAKEEPVDA